jgi:hypothetical protein
MGTVVPRRGAPCGRPRLSEARRRAVGEDADTGAYRRGAPLRREGRCPPNVVVHHRRRRRPRGDLPGTRASERTSSTSSWPTTPSRRSASTSARCGSRRSSPPDAVLRKCARNQRLRDVAITSDILSAPLGLRPRLRAVSLHARGGAGPEGHRGGDGRSRPQDR